MAERRVHRSCANARQPDAGAGRHDASISKSGGADIMKRAVEIDEMLLLAERELSFLQENLAGYAEIHRSADGRDILNGLVEALVAIERFKAGALSGMLT